MGAATGWRVTRGRSLALGAKTPWKVVRWALGGGQGEGTAPLRRVLVPPVVEATQPAVRRRPAGAVAAESLEALSVIPMHSGASVQGEAHAGGDEAAGRDGHLHRQRVLHARRVPPDERTWACDVGG